MPSTSRKSLRQCWCARHVWQFLFTTNIIHTEGRIMIYATRRERIEAEKLQLRGRRMRTLKASMAGFATFAGVTVAGVAPAHADHTVESGDTLSGIAAQYDGVSVSSLMESNGLSSHLIYPGQNLSFDGSSSSS